MYSRLIAPLLASLIVFPGLAAQDTRTVIEPVIPPACATLDARLTAAGNTLAHADESRLDTARIQQAIDHCAQGRGVLLRTSGAGNAYLSGPLKLRAGVTLIVDKGVTLFASRDPSFYAVTPGSCGIVAFGPRQRGCKPLISVDHALNSAIMGDGAIDGRGGEKMLGSKYSWWDLAEQTNLAPSGVPSLRFALSPSPCEWRGTSKLTIEEAYTVKAIPRNGQGARRVGCVRLWQTANGKTRESCNNKRPLDSIFPGAPFSGQRTGSILSGEKMVSEDGQVGVYPRVPAWILLPPLALMAIMAQMGNQTTYKPRESHACHACHSRSNRLRSGTHGTVNVAGCSNESL